MGNFAINYLDDLGSAELEDRADEAFNTLRRLLADFGLKESFEKSCSPSTIMIFLGIEVNTNLFTLSIPQDKWKQILQLLLDWKQKTVASKTETQSLAGSLNFACKCVRSGRVYLSRILNFLRTLPRYGKVPIPSTVRADIEWWIEFAPTFNRVSLMLEAEWSSPDATFSCDSCLTGGGAYAAGDYIHWEYPEKIKTGY